MFTLTTIPTAITTTTTTTPTTTMTTTTTTAPKAPKQSGEDHIPSWTASVAIGVIIVVLLAIGVLVTCVYLKRYKRDEDNETNPSNNGIAMVHKKKNERPDSAKSQFWEEEDDSAVYRDPAVLQMLRRNLYSINLPPEELQVPPLPIDKRTFASSNYRILYETARCFADTR